MYRSHIVCIYEVFDQKVAPSLISSDCSSDRLRRRWQFLSSGEVRSSIRSRGLSDFCFIDHDNRSVTQTYTPSRAIGGNTERLPLYNRNGFLSLTFNSFIGNNVVHPLRGSHSGSSTLIGK